MDKTAYMMGDATKEMLLLEVGPSYNPIVTKADGWNIRVVDHATKGELESKYREWNVDVSRMEDVDFLWRGGPLHEAIPEELHGKFERVLASHVIEHMPDLLMFLQSVSMLLSPTGTLALAIPDKRFCFDFFRPTTMTSDVVAANMRGASLHSFKTAFETYFYNANCAGSIAWNGHPPGDIGIHHGWQVGVDAFNGFCNAPAGTYIDMHASCFTPCSFELIAMELAGLGLCDLTVRDRLPTGGYEFFVVLEKNGEGFAEMADQQITERRRLLLLGMLEETHHQLEMLRSSQRSVKAEVAAEAAVAAEADVPVVSA